MPVPKSESKNDGQLPAKTNETERSDQSKLAFSKEIIGIMKDILTQNIVKIPLAAVHTPTVFSLIIHLM